MITDMQYRFGGQLAKVMAKRIGIEKRGDEIAIFAGDGDDASVGPPITGPLRRPLLCGDWILFALAGSVRHRGALQRDTGRLSWQSKVTISSVGARMSAPRCPVVAVWKSRLLWAHHFGAPYRIYTVPTSGVTLASGNAANKPLVTAMKPRVDYVGRMQRKPTLATFKTAMLSQADMYHLNIPFDPQRKA